jgi:lysozyme family protein
MDFLELQPILSKLIPYAGQIKAIINAARSNEEIGDKIKAMAPDVAEILAGMGGQLFPRLAPALQIAAAAIATFDPDLTKWLQGALNSYLNLKPPLEVDGVMGPKTIEAVQQAQEKLGIDSDGFAGKITLEALKRALEAQKKP